jgi:transcriptional regulator with XRE-family HTH domain
MLNRAVDIGRERARYLAVRFGRELRIARVSAGLTQEQLASRARVSQAFVSLVERGLRRPRWDVACRLAAGCGYELSVRLHPADGLRLRDSGQMELAEVVADATHPAWRLRLEDPIGDGSRRAVDIAMDHAEEIAVVELERGLADFQAQYRAAALKREAVATASDRPVRLIIGVPDTEATRRILAQHADLIRRVLPVTSRSIWHALRNGIPIGGDGILFVPTRASRRHRTPAEPAQQRRMTA